MKNLKVLNLYENVKDKQKEEFLEKVDSNLDVQTEYQKVTEDTEWVDMMELTIPYLDNILRNPNRFIINEEEIVKIELARRITVDSIKHLSKNTNFIQDFDQETGDVRPSKILNINKEESYDTYENRFIYSLIENMKFFISRKKKGVISRVSLNQKDNKKINYTGLSKVDNEKIDIKLELSTNINQKGDSQSVLDRIEKIEQKIVDLCCAETYKLLAKRHISLVTSPIKKTNVILKNVNFQYAVKLWNYLQTNLDDKSKSVNSKEAYRDNDDLKSLVDETFLLDYLIIKSLSKDEGESEDDKQTKQKITNQILEKIVYLNTSLSEEQLKEMLSDTYAKIKYKNAASIAELQDVYKKHIDKYIENIRS